MKWSVVLSLFAVGCGGGGGAVGTDVEFDQVLGIENQVIFVMAPTSEGLFFGRGLSNSRPMHAVDGNAVALTSSAGDVYRAMVAPGGTVFFTSGTGPDVFRVEPPDTPVEGTLSDSAREVLIDGDGGIYVAAGAGISYRAPGAADFVEVELDAATIPSVSLGSIAASSDGAAYAWNTVGGSQGVLRMQGGEVERILSCDQAEFSFCNAGGKFAAGSAGPLVIMVENVFSETGGELYQLEGTTLERIASVPPEHRNIQSLVRGPDGDLYASATEDNLAGSDCYLYRLDGDQWQQLGQLPDVGSISFGGDGRLYAAISVVGSGRGGLWVSKN